jgi:tungstate transport system ATP-binding protein
MNLWQDVFTSLLVSGSATIIALIIGLPLASVCARNEFVFKRTLLTVIRAMYGLPPVVVGVAVYLMFSKQGIFSGLELLFTIQGMIVAQSLLILPLVWGVSWTSMAAIPKEVLETYKMIGVSRPEVITHLMEARKGVSGAVMLAFGRAIAEVGAVMIVGGNIAGHTRTLTTSIVLETQQGRLEQGLLLGMVLLGIAMVASLVILAIEDGWMKGKRKNIVEKEPVLKNKKTNSISCDNVGLYFGDKEIITDFNLQLKGGECVAILGASGSGKTSLLRMVSGLQTQSVGEITRTGKILMIHQQPVVMQGDLIDNLCYSGIGDDEAFWWLGKVGIEEYYERLPNTLSGGERQRLAVIRGLASQPDILILDEFTSSLDGPNVSVLEYLIKKHTDLGGSVLMATHNPFQAKRIADRYLIIENGCLIGEDQADPALLDGTWLG